MGGNVPLVLATIVTTLIGVGTSVGTVTHRRVVKRRRDLSIAHDIYRALFGEEKTESNPVPAEGLIDRFTRLEGEVRAMSKGMMPNGLNTQRPGDQLLRILRTQEAILKRLPPEDVSQ